MTIRLEHGDCRDAVRTLADCSIDSVVTDPPYSLVSIQKRFGKPGSAPAQEGKDGLYRRASAGFMGQSWDNGETAHDSAFWAEVLRVLKPGAHLVAFSGTRTYHRMACAIEDAGFEIRDMIGWLYGSGFPKSHNQSGAWEGWGTALKPAQEPIVFARKPLEGTVAANAQKYGTGAINIDGCRVPTGDTINQPSTKGTLCGAGGWDRPWKNDAGAVEARDARAREAISKAEELGRWPANIVHDGSDEVLAAFPESAGQQGDLNATGRSRPSRVAFGDMAAPLPHAARSDSGSAARFFYSAKAGKEDRWGSKHPTVKPVELMRWLCRLVTPPGGTVLEPFAGSGTTGIACIAEGFNAILIEREAEYVADIRERLAFYQGDGKHSLASKGRKTTAEKAGGQDQPLFAGPPQPAAAE